MRVFHTIAEAAPAGRSAVACGFFDGLHIGHAAVIGRAVERAGEAGLTPGVFTFT
ncbi:MAG: riboflavin biosynthesis protein RibF, partial [Anaerotruncus massiliensis (ex Togo et al. 2019)]